jgi:PAS domain S-box-containing protein
LLSLFDHRFDAFAADTHENLAARAGIAVGAGAVSLVALPWRICAMWVVSTLAIEVWGWFATRPQHQRRPVTSAEQAAFLVYLACIIGSWFYLGALLWLTGALAGAVAGAIVWLSLVGFAQTFASRSPLGFLVSGVAPALGVMLVMTLDPRLDWSERWRMGGMMTLAMGFAIAGARQTFAAGQRLEEAQARLRESEAQYRALADNTIDVIGRTGVDGIWRYMSPSVEVALGYTPAEMCAVIGPTYIYSDDRPAVRQVTAAVLADGRARTCEYRMIRKDGRMVWVESSFSLARDPVTGDETEIVCHARDVTARKAMERELVEARERAEAAAAAKADFLANMSHELRTPLNAIIGFSGVLKDSRELSERDARHARLIGDASDTLLLVVNDVLDFSKLESGAFELDPQPCDPMAIALSATMLVEPQAKARGLTLEVIGAGGSQKLMVDGPRLRQVLLNLLSNALKFTPDGGVTVQVEQSPAPDDGPEGAAAGLRRLRIAVSDTGIGISDDKLEAVFERFNQADVSVSRRFGGTGLGLAICKRIVGLMGGWIGVESHKDEGSTFWFEIDLPVAAAADTAPAHAVESTALERPLRLLLVEDVDVNRELVRVMLEPFDIDIESATNGVEAIEAVMRSAYDLVLMDVQMPIMDGMTAAARIRELEDPAQPRLPIIAMTANVLPDQVRRCLAAGMDGHVGKPINPAELLETIAAWTGGTEEATARRALAGSGLGAA